MEGHVNVHPRRPTAARFAVRAFAGRVLRAALLVVLAGATAATSAGLAAQEREAADADQEKPRSPEGWMVRTDRGGHGPGEAIDFKDMPPGWHITTGPAAIFYRPDQTASGTYRVEAETHLFDPGQRREGYGIIFGGKELDADAQEYTYFLIRRDGSYLVKRRDGAETAVIQGWTEHPAIVAWDEKPEDAATTRNLLAVEVGDSELAFFVNGEEVHRLPREGLSTDGVVGLRVNHSLDLHVTRLDVAPLDTGE